MMHPIRRGQLRRRQVGISNAIACLRIAIVAFLLVAIYTHRPLHADGNMLFNGDFESSSGVANDGTNRAWEYSHFAHRPLTRRQGDIFYPACSGAYHYATDDDKDAMLSQSVMLTNPHWGLDQDRLARGGYYAEFGGWQRSYAEFFSPIDAGRIGLQVSGPGVATTTTDLGWQNFTAWWRHHEGSVPIHPGANTLTYRFEAVRYDTVPGGYNDAWLDEAHLTVKENHIWSVTKEGVHTLWGQGDRQVASDFNLGLHTGVTHNATLTTSGAVYGYGQGDTIWDYRSVVHIDGGQWVSTGSVYLVDASIDIVNGSWVSQGPETVVGRDSVDLGNSSVTVRPDGQWICRANTTVGGHYGNGVWVDGGHWLVEMGRSLDIGVGGFADVVIENAGGLATMGAVSVKDALLTIGKPSSAGSWLSLAPVAIGSSSDNRGVILEAGGLWQSEHEVTLGGDGAGPGSVTIDGGHWNATDLVTVNAGSTLSIEGGTMSASILLVEGGLLFDGGTLELPAADSQLMVTSPALSIGGAEIVGNGFCAAAQGIDLGAPDRPGRLAGYDAVRRLGVLGDVTGSGALEHLNLVGNIDIGSSPGEVTLSDVSMSAGSTICLEIEGLGEGEFDRLILGHDVNLLHSRIELCFAEGFTPGHGAQLPIIAPLGGASLTDALYAVTIACPDNTEFDRSTGILTVVPEPATAMLLIAGMTCLSARRRHRPRSE